MLLDVMPRHPDRLLTVLARHTHSWADLEVLPNLRVRVGGTDYGRPVVQDVLLVG
jgi:hypothetical protein